MKKTFLKLLADSRLDRESKQVDLDYTELYRLSRMHQVTALVYNQIYKFNGIPEELKEQWKKDTLKINAIQTIKTEKFLKTYNKFICNDLKVIAVKGIICRSLYPVPDNRPSNDEDLYIRKEDKDKVKDILLNEGFTLAVESDDVDTYVDLVSGLSIELHTSLFSKESKAYGKYQDEFDNAFDTLVKHDINGQEVYSLSYDLHLLFLLLHFTKHFLHGGVGIRQVLDIVMYIEAYKDKFNWNHIYEVLDELHIQTFIVNILGLAYVHLELDIDSFQYPKDFHLLDNDDLLDDILDAGVFGKSSMERVHSSTMTLNASTGNKSILRSIFPTSKELSGRYTYLKKYPFLLPIAWLNRIFHYVTDKNNGDSSKTVEIGNQRIELLKKYDMIK